MEEYEAMYHTPLGFKLVRFQAESMDEAKCFAESRCQFGIVELVWVRQSGSEVVRYERAKERRDEPPCPSEDRLDPGVVSPGEHHEVSRELHVAPVPVAVGKAHVLVIGQPDEVKLLHLSKHACLVRGDFDVERLGSLDEVAGLSGVPSDSQEVPEQVCGDGVHGRANRVSGR